MAQPAPPPFDDFVSPTKVDYVGEHPATIHMRKCRLTFMASGKPTQREFNQAEIYIGSMDENDLVLDEETVSRRHCRIVQEDTSYVLVDLGSTNGTFINNVRVREAFLKPGCTVSLGKAELKFHHADEKVEVVPSRRERLGQAVGRSRKIRELFAVIEKVAPTGATLVLEGETGTGKEVIAHEAHRMSTRAEGPLMIFDCGAVPPNLIESELFGHEKGSFTGAVAQRQGVVELASGGTLLLDEIGELPLVLQPKLLRALETREIKRVGGNRPIRVDVRIIAATNRNLEDEVRAGRFRQDLFYRLSVVRLRIPPLREREEDIPLLVSHFLDKLPANRLPDGKLKVHSVSRQAMDRLRTYSWPGNVRELVNCIERSVSLADGDILEVRDLPDVVRFPSAGEVLAGAPHAVAGEDSGRVKASLGDGNFKEVKERLVASFERDYIVGLLQKTGGNISQAARDAGIDRKYLKRLMKKYGLLNDETEEED